MEQLQIGNTKESLQLQNRYKFIMEFFDRMCCSLRLLSLRKNPSTFQNISTQVQLMSKREFLYSHLAQIKYILPEVIQIDKILVHDKKTFCMKQDMKITLVFNAVEGHREQSAFLALRELFSSRILSFFNSHTEDCSIPQALLPNPFNQGSTTGSPLPLTMVEPSSDEVPLLSDSSHLSPSFNRHLSKKAVAVETENTQILASPVRCDSVTRGRDGVEISKPKDSPDVRVKPLLVDTPPQMTPKRSMPSCDDKQNPIISSEKRESCSVPPAKRSLNFTSLGADGSALNPTLDVTLQDTIPPIAEALLLTAAEEKITEIHAVEESSGFTAWDEKAAHQHMSAGLPNLFSLIHQIFQSVNCSSITKDELVHKIIINSLDITEKMVVEEQLELLEKLAPECICRKFAPTGDFLYNMSKVSDINLVNARLTEWQRSSLAVSL